MDLEKAPSDLKRAAMSMPVFGKPFGQRNILMCDSCKLYQLWILSQRDRRNPIVGAFV